MKSVSHALAVFLLLFSGCNLTGDAVPEGRLLFDGGRAFLELEKQVSFGPRVPGSDGWRECSAYLLKTLAAYADTVWADCWTHVTAAGDTLPMSNIRASFEPDKKERVLLCAHWDTRPVAEHDPDPGKRMTPIPGANDGASGVAVLVELARVFSLKNPGVGVDIVLFDGEDYGDFHRMEDVLIGSERFAASERGYRPVMGILLDMVGDREASFPYEGNSWAALPNHCSLVWDTAVSLGYGRYFAKQAGPRIIDDHIPLLKAGIRCIDIIQMGLPYWHTQADTPDKCSPATLEAVGRTVAAVVYRLPGKNN